ncbi:MAG TPA: TlpA disulfide reductase family protein [Streptosporangiaceae bacterium]|nr:TlpA disulfide reductase family protein [Streptosporangiaceae bacterium]
MSCSARLPAIAAAAVATLALAGCGGGAIGADTPASSGQSFVGSAYTSTVFRAGARPAAPDISGTTLAGQHLSLSAYRGSVVVLNFWGSWCSPCRAEAPDLTALATNYSARGIKFLGIDIRDDRVSADAFVQTFRTPYPSLNDPADELALAFRGTVPPAAIPSTLVIDRTGHIAARILGSVSYDSLRALITQVTRG